MKTSTLISIVCLVATLHGISVLGQDRPVLSIERAGPGHVRLFWPSSAPDFVLEEQREFSSSGVWSSCSDTPVVEGGFYVVTIPIDAEVVKGDEVLRLRDKNGIPVWAGWRRR